MREYPLQYASTDKNKKSHYNSRTLYRRNLHCLGFKGCGMGPWLVLVSSCFRENVVATCKIGCFCVVYIIYFRKTVLFSFLEIKFQNGAHLKKGLYFDLLFTFFSHQGKLQKFLQHISHSHTNTYFAHSIDLFCLTNFEKNTNLLVRQIKLRIQALINILIFTDRCSFLSLTPFIVNIWWV